MKLRIFSLGLALAALIAPRHASADITVQAWYHFGETNNFQADSTTNGRNYLNAFSFSPNPPTIGPTRSTMAVGGPLGNSGYTSTNSLRFGLNGTQSSFWNTGYNPPGANYGIEMWFLPQNLGIVGTQVSSWLFSDGGGQVAVPGGPWGGEGVLISPNFDGTVSLSPFMITGPNSSQIAMFSQHATAGTNEWIHLALVNTNGMVVFYTNGVVCAVNDTGTGFTPAGAMYIGTDGDNFAPDGYIDEERVFTFADGAFTTNDLLLRPPGPGIVGQPGNTTVWSGGAANFSVNAVLDPADTFQWQEAGAQIPGATSDTLNLNLVALTDSGNQVAVGITNNGIGVLSSNATLTVVANNLANVLAYSNAVMSEPSLLAYFPMDGDTGTTVANVVDAAHSGVLEGGAVFDSQTNRAFGQRALYLTQNGDAQITPNSAFEFGSGSGTVEALIYLGASGSFGDLAIFSVATSDGSGIRYEVAASADGSSLYYTNDSGVQLTWPAPVNLLNRQAHVAFTFSNSTNVTAYLDGASLGAKTQTGFGSATGVPAWIGSVTTNVPGLWYGTIDDVALYSAALPANTIAIHNSKFVFGTNTSGPGIVSQSGSANLYAGGTPVLSVTASGTPPLSYQWLTNGTPVTGATASTLALGNTTTASSGTYTVQVNNPIGPVTNSAPIVLTFTAPPAGYASTIMNDHPAAYWRLDEPSGTTMFDFAGGLNGTYTGAFALGAPGAILGDPDTSVNFTGGNAPVPYAPVLNPNGPFTVEMWVKPNTGGAGVPISSQFRNGSGRSGFIIYNRFDGAGLETELGSPAGVVVDIISPRATTPGVWYHVALVWDGATTGTLYVDGESAGSGSTGAFSANPSAPLEIGVRNGGADAFNGSIDEVAFYDYALTQAQLQAHVGIGLPLSTTTSTATNVIADSKPVGAPFDGISINTFWSNSVSDGVTTRTGVAQFFSQSNCEITVPGYAAFSNALSTITFWMKSKGTNGLTSVGGNEGGILFDWRPGGGVGGMAFILHDAGTFFVQSMNNYNHFDSVALVNDNNWHFCAVTMDPSITGGVNLYIDGALDSSVPNTAAWFWPNGQTMEFGQDSLYDGYWRNYNGAMDDIRIYNRLLTPTEVSSIYTSDALVDTTALVLRYNFDGPPDGWNITWPYGTLQAEPSLVNPNAFITLTNVVSPFPVAQHPGTMRYFRAAQ